MEIRVFTMEHSENALYESKYQQTIVHLSRNVPYMQCASYAVQFCRTICNIYNIVSFVDVPNTSHEDRWPHDSV